MKWVAGFVVVAALVAGVVLLWPGSNSPNPPNSPDTAGAPPDDRAGLRPGPARGAAEDPALARLREEIAAADAVSGRTDAERLADARAWVDANRPPDRPYNEVEARMLALWDAILQGEDQSTLMALNASRMVFEMVRALDADGDGLVTDAERAAFADANLVMLSGPDHPYLFALIDTNGDGALGDDETGAWAGADEMDPEGGLFKRALLDAYDADNDGVLSADEQGLAESRPGERYRVILDQRMAAEEAAGAFAGADGPAMRAAAEARIMAELNDELARNPRLSAAYDAVSALISAMTVEDVPTTHLRDAMMADMPPPPDESAFDTDGDGAIGPAEAAPYMDAVNDYQKDAAAVISRYSVLVRQAQFDHAAAAGDLNGDGRITPDEWDARLDTLLAERDRRLFLRSNDLDGDGRVGQSELMSFVDWHKAGSPRADANFDGLVDARDLQTAMTSYERQGD